MVGGVMVHSLRSTGFADLGDPALEFEGRGLFDILQIAIACDAYAGVVAPVRRIADLIFDSFQLDDSLFLGGGPSSN